MITTNTLLFIVIVLLLIILILLSLPLVKKLFFNKHINMLDGDKPFWED
jgi:hypothetical protein